MQLQQNPSAASFVTALGAYRRLAVYMDAEHSVDSAVLLRRKHEQSQVDNKRRCRAI